MTECLPYFEIHNGIKQFTQKRAESFISVPNQWFYHWCVDYEIKDFLSSS